MLLSQGLFKLKVLKGKVRHSHWRVGTATLPLMPMPPEERLVEGRKCAPWAGEFPERVQSFKNQSQTKTTMKRDNHITSQCVAKVKSVYEEGDPGTNSHMQYKAL